MTLAETVHGVTALPILAITVYYANTVRQHFRSHPDVACTKMFIDDRAVTAFKVVAGSTLFHATASFMSAFGLFHGHAELNIVSKIGNTVVFLGMAYFFKTMATVTQKSRAP